MVLRAPGYGDDDLAVAIYLDANVLWSWRTLAEPERLALSIVADQIGQRVLIPEIAAEEAEAHYRRTLENAVADFERAGTALDRAFRRKFIYDPEPMPWPEEETREWRDRLDGLGEVLPLVPEDAVAAMKREIQGVPPARRERTKTGRGARDAAIWLAVCRDHRARGEAGHFISEDGDFGRDDLDPGLVADLDGLPPLRLYKGIKSFLAILGTKTNDPSVTCEVLSERVEPILDEALRFRPDVPKALLTEFDPNQRYRTFVRTAEPVKVITAQRYATAEAAVTAVDSEWRLRVGLGLPSEPIAADQGEIETWGTYEDLPVQGRIQVYIPAVDTPAQFIGAQLHSNTDIEIYPDGSASIWTIG